MVLGVPIFKHIIISYYNYNEAVVCLNFGTPENNEFSIWDK